MSNEQARSANRLPVDEGRDQLMVQVARMAYQQDLTHTDIASRTGLNRWQVSRLLQFFYAGSEFNRVDHIVLAGGGTAGHTSPLIATAEQLREHPDVAVTAA
mgnify:CR=1 FL=1